MAEEVLLGVAARVQVPCRVNPVQSQDGANVVLQDDIPVQATCDETPSLEQVVVVLLPCSLEGFS